MSWESHTPDGSGADAWGEALEIPKERYTDGLFLGRGGMGVVHSVVDRHLDRVVARKVVRAPSEHAEARLLREARITAGLDHPGVVPVHDVGRLEDGRLYYTMRLVSGRTLEAALPELPRPRALRHLLDVCGVVAFAHQQGVVHRDLKASNILVGAFGETQVADWGVAASVHEPRTLVGTVGTPATMSPEVARGEAAGPHSDVWALGCLLCVVVTKAPPFGQGEQALERLRSGPITPPILDDPELSAILRRAMEEEPAARYATASAFAADLEAWLDGRPVGAYAYSMSETLRRFVWAWRGPLLATTAIACTLAGAAGWAAWHTAQERDRALAAEQHALQARDAAELAEAQALQSWALQALSQDDRPRAELFAARSLELLPSPDTLGVLAAWHGVPRPRSLERRPLDCDRVQLLRGEVLCSRSGGVELQGARLEGVQAVFALPDGSDAVLRTRNRLERWRAGRLASEVELFAGRLQIAPGQARMLHIGLGTARSIDLDQGTVEVLTTCVGSRPEAGNFASDGGLWVACADGRLEHMGPRSEVREIPTGYGLASVIVEVEQEPLVGTLHGALIAGEHVLQVFDGPIASITPSPDGTLLLARRLGGELAVVAREGLLLLTRLPTRAEDAGWVSQHVVRVVASDGREDFAIPGVRAVRWPGSEGVATVAVSDGGRLAIGRGDGTLTVFQPDRIQHIGGFEGVLKHAAFEPRGERLLFAGHDPHQVGIVEPDGRVTRWATRATSRVFWQGSRIGWVPYAAPIRVGDPSASRELEARRIVDLDPSEDGVLLLESLGAITRLRGDVLEPIGRGPAASSIVATGEGWALGIGTRILDGEHTWELPEPVMEVAVSRDGRWLAAGLQSGRILVQDRHTRELVLRLNGHRQRVASLVFDPHGQLFSGSWDGSVRRWDLSVVDEPVAHLVAELRRDWGRDERSLLTPSWPNSR